MKNRLNYNIILTLCLLLTGTMMSMGQIGGNFSPLKFSVHEYSIEMDNTAYTAQWGIYPLGTTQAQLEAGTAVALLGNGTDYTFVSTSKSGGRAYFRVQFNGSMAVYNESVPNSGQYLIGYVETTSDGYECASATLEPFTLYPPFDVDVALGPGYVAAECPTNSTVLIQGPPVTQTTFEYLVNVVYPGVSDGGYIEGETWSFNFEFDINGVAGNNATIDNITATGIGMAPLSWTPVPGTSFYTAECVVNPSQVHPVTFTLVFNDVPEVDQEIIFEISSIKGFYNEQDIDEVNGTAGNRLSHTIYAMPDVGQILAWE